MSSLDWNHQVTFGSEYIYIYIGSWSLSGIILYSKQYLYHEVIFSFITGTSTSIYRRRRILLFHFHVRKQDLTCVRPSMSVYISVMVWIIFCCMSESFTGRAFHIREQVILPQYMFTRSCNPFFIIWIIVNQMCCLLYNQISSRKR